MSLLLLLIVIAPLAAAGTILLTRRAPEALGLVGVFISATAALFTLLTAGGASAALPWLPGMPVLLRADALGLLLAVMVGGTGLLVSVYAVGYMKGERDRVRFFAELAFFIGAMQALVLAGDWVLFLASWELIALASYLLIGFWNERPGVAGAATRAFLTTRAADVGLYLAVFAVYAAGGGTGMDASAAAPSVPGWVGPAMLLAAAGKAAQIPLQGWLMDAMAGPTPVSALLHSATLVAAGVVLLLRGFPLLGPDTLLLVGLVGGVTAVAAGLIAVAQQDLKRMLAASTSSQLGLMFLALGAGAPGAAAFHMLTQAAMKSSLFMGAGIFQHSRSSTSLAALRGAGRDRRLAFAGFAAAGLALSGVPPLAGFWSKDSVTAAALASPHAWALGPLALGGTLLTGVYVAGAIRVLWDGSTGPTERGRDGWMAGALAVGAALSIVLGALRWLLPPLLRVELPESTLAAGSSLAAALLGLSAGWAAPAEWLPPRLAGPARAGLRLGGGWTGLTVLPVLALARRVVRADDAVHRVVLAAGGGGLRAAAAVRGSDSAVHVVVESVGWGFLLSAYRVRDVWERKIDAGVFGLVRATRETGRTARRLQSGLVHREMALAVGGVAVLLLLLAAGLIISA